MYLPFLKYYILCTSIEKHDIIEIVGFHKILMCETVCTVQNKSNAIRLGCHVYLRNLLI